jgi:hypothetical protein
MRLASQCFDSNITSDRQKPSAKSTTLRLFQPVVDRLRDRSENLLHDIVSIGRLQPLTQCEPVHQRPVDRHELIPRRHIRRVSKTHD